MTKEVYIGTDAKEFKKVLDSFIYEELSKDRRSRIIQKYSPKYSIEDEVVVINERRVNIDYLPTIDLMLDAQKKYKNPEDVVGAALFKIDKDQCIYLTDTNDANLQRNYELHKKNGIELGRKLWKLNSEEFDNQLTHVTAKILSGSFHTVFGKFYGEWRKNLSNC